MKTKANLGCGPLPLSIQDLEVMGNPDEWLLVDKYIHQPGIDNWDIQELIQIPDNHLTHLYTSHALEHLSYREIPTILKHWWTKLAKYGIITINVPDLIYACKQTLKWEQGQFTDGLYNEFFGPRGVLNIFYGTHSQEGEFHFSGFTPKSLRMQLEQAGFTDVDIQQVYDMHEMGVLIATATKK